MKKKITKDSFKGMEKLYSAVICVVLDDKLGFENNRYIVGDKIRPLYPGAVVIGRAATVLAVPAYTKPDKPYQREIDFIDSLKPGDVVVATQSGARSASLWDALLSTGAKYRGARGAV